MPADRATIITMDGCFHGRTTTIVGFSTDPDARRGFGPFTPGFRSVPFGDLDAIAAAIDETTAAVLLEPVQGEAGVVIPPPGYLRAVRALCDREGVLLIADEIQSGLGRTGETLACDHEGVRPDLVLLGKALGGGIVPISAVVGTAEVVGTLDPGSHGSTFGGNPLACAIAREVVDLVRSGEPQIAARTLGEHLTDGLEQVRRTTPGAVTAVRTIGAWAGIDLHPSTGTGRSISEALVERGILMKDTQAHTLRMAPPLTTDPADLDWAIGQLGEVIAAAAGPPLDEHRSRRRDRADHDHDRDPEVLVPGTRPTTSDAVAAVALAVELMEAAHRRRAAAGAPPGAAPGPPGRRPGEHGLLDGAHRRGGPHQRSGPGRRAAAVTARGDGLAPLPGTGRPGAAAQRGGGRPGRAPARGRRAAVAPPARERGDRARRRRSRPSPATWPGGGPRASG